LWVCILIALVPVSAQAGITYLSQNRFVSAANSGANTSGSGGLAIADLSLSEFGGADIFAAASRGSIESAASRYVSIDERLTLSAGSYVLEIDASTEGNYEGGPDTPTSGGGGSAMCDIDANTLALPAPAALSLLLPGLAGLTWLRRKVI